MFISFELECIFVDYHLSVVEKFSALEKYVKHFFRTNYPCFWWNVCFSLMKWILIIINAIRLSANLSIRNRVRIKQKKKSCGANTNDNLIVKKKIQFSQPIWVYERGKVNVSIETSLFDNFPYNSIKICVDCVTIIVTRMLGISACPILRCSVANAMLAIASWCAQQLFNFQPRITIFFILSFICVWCQIYVIPHLFHYDYYSLSLCCFLLLLFDGLEKWVLSESCHDDRLTATNLSVTKCDGFWAPISRVTCAIGESSKSNLHIPLKTKTHTVQNNIFRGFRHNYD